ncbi:FmdB family zinc ribbon protein [Streptomyces subrutilus]|uniref:Zinc ribbon domain-containing protein n=2 Tax=Streptomyces subrutilus TaxID=36818 RepID=A0A5P2UQW6_9ACTN|nr:zinc ribbon domain-containing protein [Streptomyces subrutilus]QEU80769.1 zinc ribbon domain-containing protein [Streptomyces subrutilus]
MPRYEYRCRTCEDTFEVSRPMAESSAPADCPAGHSDTVKLLSAVAVGGSSAGAPAPAMGGGGGGGGGCCGGGGCG